jgi:outer membrane receptor for ferrienterochelin and colicin
MKPTQLSLIASAILYGTISTADISKPNESISLEAISIESLSDIIEKQGKVKDIVEKTEVISKKQIDKQQAITLVEAIERAAGVDVTTNCSMCGIKRVMLNGMRGEHTTVLADGVPFHSTVSSYYGMDALGTSDVESIEIARGSGASLTAPEAIGGTINIVSRRAKKNGMEFDFAAGEQGYRVGSFVGEGITTDGKTGVIVSGMLSNYDQYDRDSNGLNEAPSIKNQIMSVKVTHELTSKDLIDVKVGHSTSDVFGGPIVSESEAYAAWGASGGSANPSFVGGDVRNKYNGDPMGSLEAVKTTRNEAIAKWTHIGNTTTLQTTLAFADAKQESMYEGFDYDNIDKTYFADLKISQMFNNDHFLTYGADFKQETMRAQASAFDNGLIERDDFDYNSYALYLQDTWTINDKTELNLALRAAKITTDFRGQTAQGNEIDETILAPRAHLRYHHNDYMTSRLSGGIGYRSPLTFFESEHGLLDNGFAVDISKIEKSKSAAYSLSFDRGPLSLTAGGAYTQVENLAYIDNDIDPTKPTLRNFDSKLAVKNGDIVGSYALTPTMTLSAGYEQYWYDTEYKNLLFIAAVEKQGRLMFDYEEDGWNAMVQATWTASRKLGDYGYNDRFNDDALTLPKNTKAPAFTTVDIKASKEITKTFSLYAGVKNLFDYVQTDKETPLFYEDDGAGGAAFDVGHIWGPLRGRMAYAGIKAKF